MAIPSDLYGRPTVALLAEGVDRNLDDVDCVNDEVKVALLAEGVDRNQRTRNGYTAQTASPSSRRAWIEMKKR